MKKRFLAFGLLLAAMVVVSGCSKCTEINVANRMPQMKTFRFEPAAIMPGDRLQAVVTANDLDNDPYEIEYEWVVDGKKVPETTKTLNTDNVANGARITVRFRVKEVPSGKTTDWTERTIVVGAPPPASLKDVTIDPIPLGAGQDVSAVIDYGEFNSSDFTLFYKWSINGEEREGDEFTGESLNGRYLKKGDKVQVRVSDNEEFKGQIWMSSTVKVTGHPPEFSSEPSISTEGRTVIISYEVEDPDGDEVKVTLTGAPGTPKKEKNQFRLDLKDAKPGDYNMKLSAVDDTGAGVSYEISLTVPKAGAPVVAETKPVEGGEAGEQPSPEPEAKPEPTEPPEQPAEPAAEPEAKPEPEPASEQPAEQPSEPTQPTPASGSSE